MRRSNEKCKVSGYNAGRGITGQALLYQHMSNHYRRILNAKKAIDTATPATFKTKLRSTAVVASPVRSYSAVNRKSVSGNISPALTERTESTYSNGGSYLRSDGYYGRRCQKSRSNECDWRAGLEVNPSSSEIKLINHIAFETNKCGPADSIDTNWKNVEGRTNFNEFRSPYQAKKNVIRNSSSEMSKKGYGNAKLAAVKRKLSIKDKPPSDLMEKHSKCFISHNNSFYPRILKTNATSKVKNLRVYHPPRKKREMRRASQWKEEKRETNTSMNPVNVKSKCSAVPSCQNKKSIKNCKCKQPEACQTSSRDSAYNGGVSSLPESRSPTPDQRKDCCCCRKERNTYYVSVQTSDENIVVPNLKLTDNQVTQTEINVSCERKPSEKNTSRSTEYCELISRSKQLNFREEDSTRKIIKNYVSNDDEKDSFLRKIKEEALYTNFIRDITAEVLEKGLYTNKAMKKVMKRHMVSNLWLLDKDRMLTEIDKLRTQLGIPQDEDLLEVKVDATEIAADTQECYPVISDSELVEPSFHRTREYKTKKNTYAGDDSTKKRTQSSQSNNYGSDIERQFPKSISEVLSQTRDNNEIGFDTESDDDEEELISVIHVSKLIREKKKHDSFVRDISSDPSRNATQGNSADESEQSSDHVIRKKKLHTRYRKTEKTSSSSDDVEANKRVFEARKHCAGKTDNRAQSSNRGKISTPKKAADSKSESSDKEEIESLIE